MRRYTIHCKKARAREALSAKPLDRDIGGGTRRVGAVSPLVALPVLRILGPVVLDNNAGVVVGTIAILSIHILKMGPFSIECALGAIANEDIRCSTRSVIQALNETMSKMGYTYGVRDDSRLAFNWAFGTVVADLYDITEELSFVQWLSDYTSYQPTMKVVLRSIANELKMMYPVLEWAHIWSIVRLYGPELVKYVVIEFESPWGVPLLSSNAAVVPVVS